MSFYYILIHQQADGKCSDITTNHQYICRILTMIRANVTCWITYAGIICQIMTIT